MNFLNLLNKFVKIADKLPGPVDPNGTDASRGPWLGLGR